MYSFSFRLTRHCGNSTQIPRSDFPAETASEHPRGPAVDSKQASGSFSNGEPENERLGNVEEISCFFKGRRNIIQFLHVQFEESYIYVFSPLRR